MSDHEMRLGNTYAWCTCGGWESNDPVRLRAQYLAHANEESSGGHHEDR